MARPKGTTRVKKPILKRDFDRLINAVNSSIDMQSKTKVKLTTAITLLYLTGCRISEITQLTTADIKQMIRENEYSLTNGTKTKSARLIIFDNRRQQVSFLRKILPLHNDEYLFARNNSNEPMTVGSLKLQVNNFMQKTLGKLYSTHSFRAGYITTAHQQGLSLEHIRQDIGHKSIATTARYATVTNDEISKAKSSRQW